MSETNPDNNLEELVDDARDQIWLECDGKLVEIAAKRGVRIEVDELQQHVQAYAFIKETHAGQVTLTCVPIVTLDEDEEDLYLLDNKGIYPAKADLIDGNVSISPYGQDVVCPLGYQDSVVIPAKVKGKTPLASIFRTTLAFNYQKGSEFAAFPIRYKLEALLLSELSMSFGECGAEEELALLYLVKANLFQPARSITSIYDYPDEIIGKMETELVQRFDDIQKEKMRAAIMLVLRVK